MSVDFRDTIIICDIIDSNNSSDSRPVSGVADRELNILQNVTSHKHILDIYIYILKIASLAKRYVDVRL